MNMLLRHIYLYLIYLVVKFKYRDRIQFRGFTIVYARGNSHINFMKNEYAGGKTLINSHFLSNMLGVCKRTYIYAERGSTINIGCGCGISATTIAAMDRITIGNYVRIGANCTIMDNDSHPLNKSRKYPMLPGDIGHRPIIIEDECFIGANSIILKGTHLGKNCVVGAGSVVSGTFPDNSIIAGNPAKFIKKNKPAFRYENE